MAHSKRALVLPSDPVVLEALRRRFWKYATPGDPRDCWEWRGFRSANGYAGFGMNGSPTAAHRVSLALSGVPLPANTLVRHLCHNRICVNPSHLALGTHADNMRDMVEAGRQAVGGRNGSVLYPDRLARGDAHYSRRMPWRLARGDRNGSRLHPERMTRGDAHWARQDPQRVSAIHRRKYRERPELLAHVRGSRNGHSKLTERDVLAIRSRYGSGETQVALAAAFGVSQTNISDIIRRRTWAHLSSETVAR